MHKECSVNGEKFSSSTPIQYIFAIIGIVIYSFSLVCFVRPVSVPVGGISGVALLLNNLFGWSMGLVIFIINIPLLMLSYKRFGKDFVISTLIFIVVNSVVIDVFTNTVPQYTGDIYLSILYGGVGMGLGLGIVLNSGYTTGGTEIIAKILSRKTEISMGTYSLILSATIIIISAICYGNIDGAMYAIVIQFIASSVIDTILHGAMQSDGIFIVTEKPQEVSCEIMRNLKHGVTSIKGTGMFSGKEKHLLLCIVHKNEARIVKRIINQVDPSSFIMLTAAKEVYGKGFQHYQQ